MKIGYFTVQGEDCFFGISDLLTRELRKSFKTDIIDGAIFFSEEFSIMNSSNLMTVVRIQKLQGNDNSCEIEIVSGGGGDGVLALTFGNERRRLNKILGLVTNFCKYKRYQLSELVSK